MAGERRHALTSLMLGIFGSPAAVPSKRSIACAVRSNFGTDVARHLIGASPRLRGLVRWVCFSQQYTAGGYSVTSQAPNGELRCT
jgi:hypothetical protein